LDNLNFCRKIYGDIYKNVCSAVYDTPQNGDSAVYHTSKNGDSEVILTLQVVKQMKASTALKGTIIKRRLVIHTFII